MQEIILKEGNTKMKAIIYLRTSTKDQNPELQKEDCIKFCAERSLEVVEVVSEQGSAYKLEKVRPKWEATVKRAKKERLDIVIWKYDRCFRNRKEFFNFMKVMFEVYEKKVYSITEHSIINFWELMDKFKPTGNPVFDELLKGIFKVLWDFMIQNAGESAEDESKKKSERVKMAIRKEGGVTRSYKGKKWGRKALKIDDKIIAAYQEGKNYRKITEEVFYWDKSNHKKFVSLGYVHKTIAVFKERESLAKKEEKK